MWLSEIMLQQTQVVTVLDYYARFLERFPDVRALAAASLDDVLSLWSGLGYYSRAHNLHRCAQKDWSMSSTAFFLQQLHCWQTCRELVALPRVRLRLLFFAARPILDANVRRVLTRLLGFDADLAVAKMSGLCGILQNHCCLWISSR